MTPDQLKKLLPRREFWYSHEIAEAFGCELSTIQRAAKKHGIGSIQPRSVGARGVRVFVESSLDQLCKVIRSSV